MNYKTIYLILLLIFFSNLFSGCFTYVSNEFEEDDNYIYVQESELLPPSIIEVVPIIIITPEKKINQDYKFRENGNIYSLVSKPKRNESFLNAERNFNTTIEKNNRKINSNKETKR